MRWYEMPCAICFDLEDPLLFRATREVQWYKGADRRLYPVHDTCARGMPHREWLKLIAATVYPDEAKRVYGS